MNDADMLRLTYGDSPFVLAVAKGDLDQVRRLLAAGANVDETSSFRRSPISVAASLGHIDILEMLLPRARTPHAIENALVSAVLAGKLEIFRVLLPHAHSDDLSPTLMYLAARHGHREIVELLLSYNLDPNVPLDETDYPIAGAIEFGHEHVVRLLLDSGARWDVPGSEGESLNELAASRGHHHIAELLERAKSGLA